MKKDALLSEDRRYRYWLLRVWDERLPVNCICGINPSTADENEDDATIRKDVGFSARQGFGGLLKLNVLAYRSTDPRELRDACDPVGDKNCPSDLRAYYDRFGAQRFIAAWGKNGNYFPRQCQAILDEFREALCFGKNLDGTPRHTLMLPYSTDVEAIKETRECQRQN